MKTKHLLTALALPAVFAACTAEDIVTEGASVNEAQRIALNENFKMNFGGVESRLNAGEPGAALQYAFEEGDMVGGAVIDQYAPASTTPETQEAYEAQYTIVPFVSANQPFTFDGAKWTINHTMVEGKYLFYYPYNEENNSRGAAKFAIPVMQELSDKTTGEFNPKAAIERYGMAVGYQFLSKEDLSASVELAPIFSYARLVLKLDNRYAGGEVEKIVLQANTVWDDKNEDSVKDAGEVTDDNFNLLGQLDNKAIADIFNESKTGKHANGAKFDWKNYNETTDFELTGSEVYPDFGSVAKYYDGTLVRTSDVMVGKVPAGTKMSVDAQNNSSFETYMVMPAQTFANSITVYVYTADGRIFSGNTAAGLVFNRNTPKKVEVYLTEAASMPYVIASQKDWNESVAKLGKKPAEFIIADPNFEITNDLKYPANEEALITVNKSVVVTGNDVTLKNIDINGTVTVAEGAKLTADVTASIDAIINHGTVVVPANPKKESRAAVDANNDGLYDYAIANIENHATLNISKDAKIALVLTNKKDATVLNEGDVTLNGATGVNYGTITNKGNINIDGASNKFTNGVREYTKDADGEYTVLVNEPTIVNENRIRVNNGTLLNKSLITNKGILSCANSAGGKIENGNATEDSERHSVNTLGVIDAKTGSTTFITTNTGKVIVYAMDQSDVAATGTIEYVATGAAAVTDKSIVTDIVAKNNLEIKLTDKEKPGSFKNLIVDGNAEIKMTWPTGETLPTITLDVKSGKAVIKSSITVSKLTVAEGASVSVPKEITLTVAQQTLAEGETLSSLLNEGTISVLGSFVAKDYNKTDDAVGYVDDNGNGTFDWKDSAEELTEAANKTAYETALKSALKEWIKLSDENAISMKFDHKFNLNDTITKKEFNDVDYYGADEMFAGWVNATSNTVGAAAKTAFTTYKNSMTDATAKEKATVLNSYSTVVAAYITELKAKADYTAFAALEDFEISVPQSSELVNIFGETKRGDVRRTDAKKNVTVSAKENALARFKEYLLDTEVEELTSEVLMVLCSETSYDNVSTYVPEYTFAFEADNVFLVYKDLIAKYAGQFGAEGMSTQPTILGDNAKGIIGWVARAANIKDDTKDVKVADKIARDYVNANSYAIYNESMKWNYTDATIAAVKRLTVDEESFEEVYE